MMAGPKAIAAISRRAMLVGVSAIAAFSLAACGGGVSIPGLQSQSAPPPQEAPPIGSGQVKVGLILPLTSSGNAAVAAQSMRNAAELALQEFNAPNIQLLVKDDGGNPAGAQAATQQALDEGAEIILGPLFAQSVVAAGQAAKARNISVIGFSTDASAASNGVYLLSFLPESDATRVVEYAVSRGKRSFAALIPDNAYGNVVEAAFRQTVARVGGRVVALEKFPSDRNGMQEAARRVAQALPQADALFLPGDPEVVPVMAQTLAAAAPDLKRVQLLGTGLWDDQRIYAEPALQGGWFAAPDGAGYKSFAKRYRAKFGSDPVRTATLAYDAVSLTAALVKTQGPQRFSAQTLTATSGFSGIDGVFRFKSNGVNERGLSVVRVTSGGPQTVSPAPRAFSGSAS
ncbi:MAG: penicillin-binding protein activator [Rhizobiales bacterium]|nr:penicillin-binding protein activator [Hyphomicrobiales bacterium]